MTPETKTAPITDVQEGRILADRANSQGMASSTDSDQCEPGRLAGPPARRVRQERLLLASKATPRLHAGPCIEALWDEEDTDDPALVTCPFCLEQIAERQRKPLIWRQRLEAIEEETTNADPTA